MTIIHDAAASNLQTALTLLKAGNTGASSSDPVTTGAAISNPATERKDEVVLSALARLAMTERSADGSSKESPTRAVILDADGKQVGRILDGGAGVFNGRALLEGYDGLSDEEVEASIKSRKAEALESGIASKGAEAFVRYVFGDKYADFVYRDVPEAQSQKDPIRAVAKLAESYGMGKVVFV